MRNPFRLSALAAVAIIAVVGCGSTAATPTTAPVAPTQAAPGVTTAPAASTVAEPGTDDGTRISVWTRASTQSQAQQLVAAYNATHKNQVDMQIVPNDNMQTKVGAAAGAGSLPDIISGDVVFMPNWAGQGLFADITSNIAALPFASTLTQGPIKASSVGGKEYGLPFIMDLSIWVYNKDLFTKAGLDPAKPPTTLAEYAADADAIQAKGGAGVNGTEIPGECFGCEVFTWWPSIWADGGTVMNADGTAATLNTDEAKKVYAIYQAWSRTPPPATRPRLAPPGSRASKPAKSASSRSPAAPSAPSPPRLTTASPRLPASQPVPSRRSSAAMPSASPATASTSSRHGTSSPGR
jgi:multiple sugar transport system substrate-binding protein